LKPRRVSKGVTRRVRTPTKKFEPQREHDQSFFGVAPNPPGYAPKD